uniref:Uncharacterized protein n=1 Tax=viral metagenome TaxID=1070528 RepID=A0A6C0BMC6_9ZZZZ
MNNAYGNQDCPPLMSDGRHVTDYRPSCYVHDLILRQNGITNSYDLKMLLTHQAMQLQENNRQYYDQKNACVSCGDYYQADPNGHLKYWDGYNQRIQYQPRGSK